VGAIAALSVVAACVLLSACSPSAQQPGPYAAEYAQAIQEAKSDYVRHILQSGKITAADMKDAEQHVIKCTADVGLVVTYTTNKWGIEEYALIVTEDTTPDQEASARACFDQWMGPIDQLYQKQYANPDNKDWNGLVAACLVRKGVAPAGFTGVDYANLMAQYAQRVDASSGPNHDGTVTYTDMSPTVVMIPGGGNLDSPEGSACQMVPLQ